VARELLTPDSCALALIDHQPQVLVASFYHRAGFRLRPFLSHLVARPVALAHVTTSRFLSL
jgi:hypothetical protein